MIVKPETTQQQPIAPESIERLRALAAEFDCVIPEDLRLLCGITLSTEDQWNKRRTGPASILIGNQRLYPRQGLKEFMEARLRRPRTQSDAKDLL